MAACPEKLVGDSDGLAEVWQGRNDDLNMAWTIQGPEYGDPPRHIDRDLPGL